MERSLPTGYRLCAVCLQAYKGSHSCKAGVPKGVSARNPVAYIGVPGRTALDIVKMDMKPDDCMSSTERRFLAEMLAGMDARFEAVTFKLANGHRYTPDFVVVENGNIAKCCEVKGSYKLHSQGRSRMAFDQARVEYPGIRWIWATWEGKGKGWSVEE